MAGRYRIENQIGEGGMGAVYLVRHVRTDEMLALKLLHADVLKDATAVERFRREARAPAKIASEHVARVTDADTAPEMGDAPFYVMEFLRGRDLDRVVAEEGPLPVTLGCEYLRQTARALDKAHQLGIIHRDLKPENLFLTHRDDGSPCIKLLDFGIARLGDTGAVNPLKTQAGYIFGTPAYMSPEQALGDIALICPATDVWALGLVAFKLMVGKDFWGEHPTARLCAMILSGPIPTPTQNGSQLGPAFDAWFAKCVARPVDERFRNAGEAIARLAESLGVRLSEQMRISTRPQPIQIGEAVTEVASPALVMSPATPNDALLIPKQKSNPLVWIGTAGAALLLVLVMIFAGSSKSKASTVAETSAQAPRALDAGLAQNTVDPAALSVAPIGSNEAPEDEPSAETAHAKPAHEPATSVAKTAAAPAAARVDESTLTRDQK
ncbi:MAG: serine/threonine-protein kinase, partial [Polyangiaceae bacterium]